MIKGGLVLASTSSGNGKTLWLAGLLRLLHNRGVRVRAAKTGPDYIDTAFHSLASGQSCYNLDSWAMRDLSFDALLSMLYHNCDIVLCEGVMGLFDSARDGKGSTAELAKKAQWPILLLVSAKGQAESLAALVKGFIDYRKNTNIVGLIVNHVASLRHQEYLQEILHREYPELPILGFLRQQPDFSLQSRHLGLVQAEEIADIDLILDRIADYLAQNINIAGLLSLVKPANIPQTDHYSEVLLPLPAKKIAIAKDQAFAFCYSAQLDIWEKQGGSLSFFSPLKDEAPDASAEMVFLPGGYPELFLPILANAEKFKTALKNFAKQKGIIYGECGGYMVLGNAIIGEDGKSYPMVGLLDLETSFKDKKRYLGYRDFYSTGKNMFGDVGQHFKGHEFHYSTGLKEKGQALWRDKAGKKHGLCKENIYGSFLHLIDRV